MRSKEERWLRAGMKEMEKEQTQIRRGCAEGDNIKTKSLWKPTDVLQGISGMRFRQVSRSVGGGHAAFRLVHVSQLSPTLQMTPKYGPKSIRPNSCLPQHTSYKRRSTTAYGDPDFPKINMIWNILGWKWFIFKEPNASKNHFCC